MNTVKKPMVLFSADTNKEIHQEKTPQIKALHVSPECAPLSKKGGLGDVAGAPSG